MLSLEFGPRNLVVSRSRDGTVTEKAGRFKKPRTRMVHQHLHAGPFSAGRHWGCGTDEDVSSDAPLPSAAHNQILCLCLQGCSRPRYEVRNWPLHFLFLFSAGMGHEVFYITCLPCIHWNLDPFLCRRLVNMWTVGHSWRE